MARGRGCGMGFACGLLLLVGGGSSSLRAQLLLDMVGFRPETSATALDRVTVVFDCSASSVGAVTVTLFRDDGLSVQAEGLVPGTGPFTLDLLLPTGVDGRRITVQGVARQEPGDVLVAGNRSLSLLVDDTGPVELEVLSPVFPLATADAVLVLRGRVRSSTGVETGGRVEFRRVDDGRLLGGGAIQGDGAFLASVTLESLPAGVPVELEGRAFDGLGNGGATWRGTVTPLAASEGGLTDLVLTPSAGSVVASPGVRVEGRVTGSQGPYQVTFLMDGRVESCLVGLAGGEAFAHMMNLPAEGTHVIALRLQKGLAVLAREELGSLSLSPSTPSAPDPEQRRRLLFRRLHGLPR